MPRFMKDITAHNLARYSRIPNTVSYKRKYPTKYYSLEQGDIILWTAGQEELNSMKTRHTNKIMRYKLYHSIIYMLDPRNQHSKDLEFYVHHDIRQQIGSVNGAMLVFHVDQHWSQAV